MFHHDTELRLNNRHSYADSGPSCRESGRFMLWVMQVQPMPVWVPPPMKPMPRMQPVLLFPPVSARAEPQP